MSLESFIGSEADEGMSSAALEKLREKMKAAAAQIAQIKKEEKKQKKKEDELLKILLKFVKTSHKKDLVLLISRVLEQNIPANFILSIILLGNPEIQQQVGETLMLKAGEHEDSEKALIFFGRKDETLPLKLRIEMDNWIKNMLSQAEESPQKLLKTAYKTEMVEIETESEFDDKKYETKKSIKRETIQLMTYVMRDFLEQNKTDEPFDKLHEFAKFILTGILNKTEESLNNRKLLEE
ncbi:MAG: hypothetical protein O3B47_05125 [bacterium]|nr:hypothetical protein [bacterium]